MKKISLNGLDMDYYKDTLNNGLEIYMLPYENKKNYFISFATKFGSEVVEFTDEKKEKHKLPLGIAHFLEHKMFEQESGEDPFAFFSKSGTGCNASTSFDNTQYICYGTKNFEANLEYLISYVNDPYYTDGNVKKEKKIIAEEIKMYEDMPDIQLEMSLRKNIFHNHPRRIDIAGTVEEINKITKEDLYTCYSNFYIPNNMFILIVGNFNKDRALEIIRKKLEYKKMQTPPQIEKIVEPSDIKEPQTKITSNIEIPKLAYGLKVPTKDLKLKDLDLNLYLNLLTTIVFGASSEFRERVRNEKMLNGIHTEWESLDGFKVFYLMASTKEPARLEEEIKSELENLSITENAFNRIKKVWIANEIRMIDNIDATVGNLYDDILKYGDIIPNRIERIRSMKLKTLQELIKKIDFNNISIVQMLPKQSENI